MEVPSQSLLHSPGRQSVVCASHLKDPQPPGGCSIWYLFCAGIHPIIQVQYQFVVPRTKKNVSYDTTSCPCTSKEGTALVLHELNANLSGGFTTIT